MHHEVVLRAGREKVPVAEESAVSVNGIPTPVGEACRQLFHFQERLSPQRLVGSSRHTQALHLIPGGMRIQGTASKKVGLPGLSAMILLAALVHAQAPISETQDPLGRNTPQESVFQFLCVEITQPEANTGIWVRDHGGRDIGVARR